MHRVCCLASGGGTTVAAIQNAIIQGHLPQVQIGLVITNRKDAGVIVRARDAGISETDILARHRSEFDSDEAWGEWMVEQCSLRDITLVGQYGWLPHTPANFVKKFAGRMINQHPVSLAPSRRARGGERLDFGGPGMYGRRAIAAALYFTQETGWLWFTRPCSHLVTDEIDGGRVLRSWAVSIRHDDSVESLQKRLLPVEHAIQIATLGDAANNQLQTVTDPVLVTEEELPILRRAKERAIRDFPKG